MPILMKKFLSKHSQLLLTLVFGICVFIFWRMRYPFALTFQEQLQLFLFDDDYFLERIAEPGGLARYVAEFLVQFYNSVTMGAVIRALMTAFPKNDNPRGQIIAKSIALFILIPIIYWHFKAK